MRGSDMWEVVRKAICENRDRSSGRQEPMHENPRGNRLRGRKNMFETQKFLETLDAMYSEGRTREAEGFLIKGLKEAAESKDPGAQLAVLNEIAGYFRTLGRHGESMKYAGEAVELAQEMGLSGTLQYGTILLNAATAGRAAGRYDEAERMYAQVEEIYRGQLRQPDYRMASLHNNRSILFSETGRLEEARRELEQAMEIISCLGDSEIEIAITHTNLGNLCLKMGRLEDGIGHLRRAIAIYERQPGPKNSHYPSALSGLGEACFRKGELENSAEAYGKAMSELEAHFGRNEAWRITEKNRKLVWDLLERQQQMKKKKFRGLSLSRGYYEAYGRPMLEQKYPGYIGRIAAGLMAVGFALMFLKEETSRSPST